MQSPLSASIPLFPVQTGMSEFGSFHHPKLPNLSARIPDAPSAGWGP